MIASAYQKWSETYGELATFTKVNTDYVRDFTAEHGIMSIPTIMVFKNGKETKRWLGIPKEQDLIGVIS